MNRCFLFCFFVVLTVSSILQTFKESNLEVSILNYFIRIKYIKYIILKVDAVSVLNGEEN